MEYFKDWKACITVFLVNHKPETKFENYVDYLLFLIHSQSAFTCSKLTTETLEQGVKYVQS